MQPKLSPEGCPTCGQLFTGKFCAACGEKRLSQHEFSLRHLIEEGVEGITHFDGKFFRTGKALFLKPGSLTQHFEAGRRVRYMKPFQLFIVANLLFFLIAQGTNLFASSLSNYYNSSLYAKFGTREVIGDKASSDAAFQQLATVFDERITAQSKSFIILFIPVLALAAALLFFRKRKQFGLHLIFATHFFSFLLLYFTGFILLIELPVHYVFHATQTDAYDSFLGIASISVFSFYLLLAIRRFYKTSWLWAFGSALMLSMVFFFSLIGYRVLLFYKIINAIS